MSRRNNDFSDGLVKFFIGLICLMPFFAGMQWGIKSALYIIPAVAVIMVTAYYFTTKKFDLSEYSSVVIGIGVFLFILIFLGSCFHREDKDYRQRYIEQRSNMGLPMY